MPTSDAGKLALRGAACPRSAGGVDISCGKPYEFLRGTTDSAVCRRGFLASGGVPRWPPTLFIASLHKTACWWTVYLLEVWGPFCSGWPACVVPLPRPKNGRGDVVEKPSRKVFDRQTTTWDINHEFETLIRFGHSSLLYGEAKSRPTMGDRVWQH